MRCERGRHQDPRSQAVKSRSRDGLPITATDVRLMFSVYRGENPPEGAAITYWLRDLGDEAPSLSIASAEGQPVATFPLPRTPGLGRVVWNLRPSKNLLTEYGGLGPDKFVRPGTYTATLSLGTAKVQQKIQVTIAPGIETR